SEFDKFGCSVRELRTRIIVIAGPSGAGKSSIASELSSLDGAVLTLCNYTTRERRISDHAGHFCYLSQGDFCKMHEARQFFLCRLSPPPQYGYRTDELRSVFTEQRRALLMFRHSGIKYLCDAIKGVPTIFLEGEPREIASRSQSGSPPAEEQVAARIEANRRLQEWMKQTGCAFIRVTNNFGGT